MFVTRPFRLGDCATDTPGVLASHADSVEMLMINAKIWTTLQFTLEVTAPTHLHRGLKYKQSVFPFVIPMVSWSKAV